MTGPATPPPRQRPSKAWLPSRRAWLGVVGAFAIGLALFAVLLMRDRRHDEFFRAPATASGPQGPDYAPLPAPVPAEGNDAIGMQRVVRDGEAPDDAERPGEATDLGRAPESASLPAQRRAPPVAAAQSVSPPRPIPSQSPAPRYPPQALRRGEEGTVNVRAQIGPDGVPTSVSLVSGSGSRLLDRAALDAVRHWRFTPAQADGHPTVGTVVVPIDFKRN